MGQNQFDFIDYDDFCEQVARVIEQDDVLGVINICSGHPEKLADRVERFINIDPITAITFTSDSAKLLINA